MKVIIVVKLMGSDLMMFVGGKDFYFLGSGIEGGKC